MTPPRETRNVAASVSQRLLNRARQERASEVLTRFSSRPGRQLLLVTCHPAHAARFPRALRVELG